MIILTDIFNHYWGAIIAFVIGVVYVLTHRQWAYAQVKTLVPQLMLAVEKRAEELLLKTGVEKKGWVVENGYNYLPSAVRMVISKPLFGFIVQQLFDEAIALAIAHKAEDSTDETEAVQGNTDAKN